MADTQQEKTYPISYVIGSLLAGLLVGTLISFAWFSTQQLPGKSLTETRSGGNGTYVPSTPDGTSTESTTPTPGGSSSGSVSTDTPISTSGRLSVEDQAAGLSVQVAQAEVSQDQWVVIHEERNGEPGNVLGAARFMPGNTSGAVTLLRGTTSGSRYFAMIYQDNGDRVFSLENDMPLHDTQGNPVLVTFMAR